MSGRSVLFCAKYIITSYYKAGCCMYALLKLGFSHWYMATGLRVFFSIALIDDLNLVLFFRL